MNKNLKKFISSIAALTMVSGLAVAPVSAANFSDVADTAVYKQAFDELYALGIFIGYEDGTIKPDNNITRAEVTKLVVATMGPSYTEAALGAANIDTQFTDVPGSHWAAGYVATGVANNFINGMDPTTFAPEENVTYAQIVKMIVAAMGYTSICERNGGYPNGYLTTASSIGVTKGVNIVGADTVVTRGQVAMLLANAVNVPIVGITDYEESATTGQLIAKTAIMDTITSGGDAKDYKTLLTENHDAYKVKGRITATPRSLDSLDNGEVKFAVEATNNFDGFAYGGSYLSAVEETMLYAGTNAEALMFTYAEAIVAKNSDDDFEILAITPYGSNDTTETEASLYETGSYSETVNNSNAVTAAEIEFYVDADSSKTKTYKLATDNGSVATQLYVNGVHVGVVTDGDVAKYIEGNDSGKVTLIDATETGKTTTDGKIDYILVDYYVDAVVDSVADGSTYKVYFSSANAVVKTMKIDTDDDDVTAAFTLDGAEIAHTDLQKDDVVSIAYDVTGNFDDSSFYDVIVSRNTITGKVTSTGEDNNDNPYYVINDTKYSASKLAQYSDIKNEGKLEAGTEYILYVNAFGKFVDYDEDTNSKNIGIFDKASIDTLDTPKIRIITSAGTKVSYTVKDSSKSKYNDLANKFYADPADDKRVVVSNNTPDSKYLKPIENLLCEYTINSNGYITAIEPLAGVVNKNGVELEYKASSTKIGSYALNESTIIIDLSSSDNNITTGSYDISKVSSKTVADLADGSNYQVILAEKSNSDSTYRYAVLLTGGATYTADTAIAVYSSTGSTYDDVQGASVTTLEVYMNGGDEVEYLKVDPGYTDYDLEKGDVFVYDTDSDGYVDDITEIFGSAHKDNYDAFMKALDTSTVTKTSTVGSKTYTKVIPTVSTMPTDWIETDDATKAGKVEYVYGIITDKNGSNVSVGLVDKFTIDQEEVDGVDKDAAADYTLNSDANVYVYDYSESKASNRVYTGYTSSVAKSQVATSQLKLEDGADSGASAHIITLKEGTAWRELNFVFAKLVDGDIAECLVILGSN